MLKTFTRYLFILGAVLIFVSCEKFFDNGSDPEKLMIKNQEITVYFMEDYNGIRNYQMVIPVKLYVRGGNPRHSTGDYSFNISAGSSLPEGLCLDNRTGVIYSDGKNIEENDGFEGFSIQVSDGKDSVNAFFFLNIERISNSKFHQAPVMQFRSPETNLRCMPDDECYGIALPMFGGTPPYTYSLYKDDVLPGGLTLNPENGVISGSIKGLKPGEYKFRIECCDAHGIKALSYGTSEKYEEYSLIITRPQ